MLFWFLTIDFNRCYWHCITKIDLHYSFCRVAMVTKQFLYNFVNFSVLILLVINAFFAAENQYHLTLFEDFDIFLYFSKWKSSCNWCGVNPTFRHKLSFPLRLILEKCWFYRVFASAFLCSFIIFYCQKKTM